MDDSTQIVAQSMVSLALTYCVHSTLLISAAWFAHRFCRIRSHTLSERMWKMAALLGLITAPLQWSFASHTPGMTVPIRLATERSPQVDAAVAFQSDIASSQPAPDGPMSHVDQRDRPASSIASRLVDEPVIDGRDSIAPTPSSPQTRSQVYLPEATEPGNGVLQAPPSMVSRYAQGESKLEGTVAPEQGDAALASSAEHPKTNPTLFRDTARRRAWGLMIVKSVAGLLIAITLMGGLRLLIQSALLHLRFAGAGRPADGRARHLLDRLQQRCQVQRPVQLVISDRCNEPLSFGLLRWTIALPMGLSEQLEKSELRALLAHELAHLSRGDIRWLWIGRVLCNCLVFQPLNLLARQSWQQSAEFCCDDWAVQHGQTRMDLARCLTRVSQWRLDGPDRSIALAATGGKTVVQRVERLVHPPTNPDRWAVPWRQRLLASASLLVAATIVWSAPRVAFSTDAVDDEPQVLLPQAVPNEAVAVPTTHQFDWQSLSERFAELDRDVQHAQQLLQELPGDNDTTQLVSTLRVQMDELHRRRASLNQLMISQSLAESDSSSNDNRSFAKE